MLHRPHVHVLQCHRSSEMTNYTSGGGGVTKSGEEQGDLELDLGSHPGPTVDSLVSYFSLLCVTFLHL